MKDGSALPLTRSVLYVPGTRPDLMAKARRLAADVVQVDLEDSVPADSKERAREAVRAFAEERAGDQHQLFSVKVNPLVDKTEYSIAGGRDDLDGVICAGVDFVAIPKVETAAEMLEADRAIAELEGERGIAPGTIRILVMIESPYGLLRMEEIATASERIHTLVYTGETDFFATLISAVDPSPVDADYVELSFGRQRTALHCMAVPLAPPLDMPAIEIGNLDFLRRSASVARRLGYAGKLCIHPSQVPVVNEVFSPSEAEVEWSKKVLDALDKVVDRDQGAVAVEGQLVDLAMAPAARRLVERAARIQAREASLAQIG